MVDKLITIGKIVAPHGVRGDVRVIPLTDFPERFQDMQQVLLEDGVSLAVENVKYHKNQVLLKFKGLDNKNAVENLRGKSIQVKPENLVALPEGHFFVFDIIGLQVFTEDEKCLGTVTDIIKTGSNDVYVVESASAEKAEQQTILVPALKDVVRLIDVAGSKMIVRLPEWD